MTPRPRTPYTTESLALAQALWAWRRRMHALGWPVDDYCLIRHAALAPMPYLLSGQPLG